METKTVNYVCAWPIKSVWDINAEFGNGEYRENPKVKKVSSFMFAPKTWQQFTEWCNDLPAEIKFRVLYIEGLKELCITTVD